MIPTIEIERGLLTDALEFVVPVDIQKTDFSVPFIKAVVDELEACEPYCDHGVGICACRAIYALRELKLRLKHKRSCPECLGDTVVFDEDGISDNCKTCHGKGWVKDRKARRTA